MEPPNTERGNTSFQKRLGPAAYTSFSDRKYRKRLEDGITISIDDYTPSKIYRTGSTVKGVVEIKPRLPFHYTRIAMKLLCESSVQLPQRHSETFHRHLDLTMPVEDRLVPRVENGYWVNSYLQAGQTYSIPFSFELGDPHDLEACPHDVESTGVRELHRQLPPSLAGIDRDAMVPHGIRIDYTLIVTLADRNWTQKEASQTIRFMPSFSKQPVLDISSTTSTLKSRATQQLKSGGFSGSTGQITLSADEPNVLVLKDSGRSYQATDIITSLHLESSKSQPAMPSTCIVSATLESQTWSQTKPIQNLPHITKAENCHSVSEPLMRNLEFSLVWEKASPGDTKVAGSKAVNTFGAQVKVSLPGLIAGKRVYLPSFYSCLIARTYCLHVLIIIASVPLRLVLPLQMALESDEDNDTGPGNNVGLPMPES
ncbi:uncharacterized protein B0J16DRAFT_404386 [Fusarium flagelliforme]|uniref:Arrestin-like N-terminal domain-containing protein n=1 Tax=Fusarium flagelliforme TaxID=2675880 RepID=A0A395M814_9HYPO|nr:uncharacterized protein B0J16DRAFT_404386 [Fusarium flagelliforme]KAH7174649.1 hypothetical protein B0J16DRAFT_404386 [Fusarium flagelliforme]RFN43986.1 hypothetical protein FIE12Z_11779 [Fusarium flagelliforme]